jgi:hypothetical protein
MHLQRLLGPPAGLPALRVPAGFATAVRDELRLDGDEPLRAKLARSRLAFAHAHVSRDDHDRALKTR